MKGLELSEQYYTRFGEPMLKEQFPGLLPRIAAGLAGAGSEVAGYDDEASQDHDFEPGFCIFLPGEDVVSRREAFLLERAYSALPKEFMGYSREKLSPAGGNRHGVLRLSDFLADRIGKTEPELSAREWLTIPEQYLLEITAGKVYRDDSGFFTKARKELSFFPPDIARKKLAGNLLYAAQCGQYNYERCLVHGESAAAQLALVSFTEAAMHCFFLLSGRYMPYYKWRFRAFSELPGYSQFHSSLEFLLTSGNTDAEAQEKKAIVGEILRKIVTGCGFPADTEPGQAAFLLNDAVTAEEIRSLHILTAVREG